MINNYLNVGALATVANIFPYNSNFCGFYFELLLFLFLDFVKTNFQESWSIRIVLMIISN